MKKRQKLEVEIQITPMLDMAFQLLFFFIMSFRTSPTEGQFAMSLLPAQPATRLDAPISETAPADELPTGLRTLPTSLYAAEGGSLGRIVLGEVDIGDMEQLASELKDILGEGGEYPFDQALIKVDPELRYAELIRVVDIFSSLGLIRVSFAELTPGLEE